MRNEDANTNANRQFLGIEDVEREKKSEVTDLQAIAIYYYYYYNNNLLL